ncbi:hypothetical protein AMST5_01441 [freshwater sediment metagenome]|uniref:Capsid protein n=1 Tax=freshwater sediment metagenome TaxID=556182 RepID=A0AA48RAF6_9ZZZZ
MNSRIEIKAALTVDEAGEITGTAWPFGSADRVGDIITKGAFASTPARLPMLWSHDQSAVIGVWDSIDETPSGLQVKGRLLIDSVEKAREVRALVTAGAVNGLSIGFKTKQATPRKGGGRTISALDLVEISVVAVPSHPDARILSAKSATKTKGESMENDNIDVEAKTVDPAELDEKFTSLETKLADLGALGSRLDKIEARLNRPGAPAIVTKQVDAAEIERKAFVDYARTGAVDTKALSVAVGAGGGYLVPPVLLNELQKNLVLFSPMRSVARVTSIGVPKVTLPMRTANLTATWVGETAPRSESDPTYAQKDFNVYEVGVYVDVSNQLLEDSLFPLESELASDLAEEFGRAEGAAFVNGVGATQPTGILHTPAVGSTVNAAGATLAADDLIGVYHELPTFYASRAVWLMNRRTIGVIRKMKATNGEYLWHDNPSAEASLAFGNAGMLLGRPVVEMPDFPDVAPSTISVAFGDIQSAYRIFDRVSVDILRDPFSVRTTGQTRFHARKRVGGDVAKAEAIRFLKTTA